MKRLYYDSVKEELNCPPIEEEIVIEIVIEHGKNLITNLTDSLIRSDSENSTVHHKSCNCVYLDATDPDRFVFSKNIEDKAL